MPNEAEGLVFCRLNMSQTSEASHCRELSTYFAPLGGKSFSILSMSFSTFFVFLSAFFETSGSKIRARADSWNSRRTCRRSAVQPALHLLSSWSRQIHHRPNRANPICHPSHPGRCTRFRAPLVVNTAMGENIHIAP